MRSAYHDALYVQDACNTTGIIHGFERAITWLQEHEPEFMRSGETERRQHPVIVLFVNKLADLTGQANYEMQPFGRAYDACQRKIEEIDAAAAVGV